MNLAEKFAGETDVVEDLFETVLGLVGFD